MRRALWLAVALAGCVTKTIEMEPGVGSFAVTLVGIDPFVDRPDGCASDFGEKDCPRPFAEATQPVTVRVSARALDKNGDPYPWNGVAQLDVRPGQLHDTGPGGKLIQFVNGETGVVEVAFTRAHGGARFWIEDCGNRVEPGSFATGVSQEIWFEGPRIDQINDWPNNRENALMPRADNVCAIVGDPRYGLGSDENGVVGFVGWSHGKTVNAPPPAIGSFVETRGCRASEHAKGNCTRGPLVVTAVDNEGFYLTDIHADSVARGFNSIFAFTFNYPEDLEVGDVLTMLRGSPVEFAGTTQLGNPIWLKDPAHRGHTLVPEPITLSAAVYSGATITYGRDDEDVMTLERLENAVVCMDGLAPAAVLRRCDLNWSGDVEREGCTIDFDAPMPPLCTEGRTPAPTYPGCDELSMKPLCLPLSAEELEACGLRSYIPSNAGEYCCERICYNDVDCVEESSAITYGQWVADVNGNYAQPDGDPVKIALVTRDAKPEFDPLVFGRLQRERVARGETAQTLKIVGNLRHVLAARPRWVITARTPLDIEIDGVCP
jgi:hypothetical protein